MSSIAGSHLPTSQDISRPVGRSAIMLGLLGVLGILAHTSIGACRPAPPATAPMSESSLMSPPRGDAHDMQPSRSDGPSEDIDMAAEEVGGVGRMQPRRKDLPGFILPGTTGPKPCEGEASDEVKDPFPGQTYPGGRPDV